MLYNLNNFTTLQLLKSSDFSHRVCRKVLGGHKECKMSKMSKMSTMTNRIGAPSGTYAKESISPPLGNNDPLRLNIIS